MITVSIESPIMAKKRHHDSDSISENKGAIANMPQEVKYDSWKKAHIGFEGVLNDTIKGIDEQMDADLAGARRHKVPKKY